MNDIEVRLKRVIRDILCDTNFENICSCKDLQECGLDSFNCIALIVAIEEEFSIHVPDHMLNVSFTNSIEDMCKTISSLISNAEYEMRGIPES